MNDFLADMEDDLDIFFDGLDAHEILVIAENRTFKAYKDADMDEAMLGRAMVFNPDSPVLTCKEIDASGLEQGSQVVLESKTYDVYAFRPDGSGLGKIELTLAQ
ncbi:head-tail joining protein [Maridesulfovibrio frigidus]|uniref:head-tail joining protein n=1 Tax=Maridesulfovibrio frigidus TaxID=340956 RepID=UPI0004E26F7A|nr:hypothetical protein [Maridesulfovibrio frigidus]